MCKKYIVRIWRKLMSIIQKTLIEIGEGGIWSLIWNPNFPYGNKLRWLSSSQNKSSLKGTGTEPSSGAININ